jgi:phosphoribosyl-ATP pyrophosphohydrolase
MAALVRHDPIAAPPAVFGAADASEIAQLYDALDRVSECRNPRTARLLAAGSCRMAQKLMEEAGEVALEAVRHRSRAVIRESADLVYHLVVLWRECGIAPDEVWAEMRRRADRLGIAEKLPKRSAHNGECGRQP